MEKKGIIKNTIAIVVVLLFIAGSFYGGYKWGFNKAKEVYEAPYGTGLYFYAEEYIPENASYTVKQRDSYIMYHSTLTCPNIKHGVERDVVYTNPKYRKRHSRFCPHCMNDFLITKCEKWLEESDSSEGK